MKILAGVGGSVSLAALLIYMSGCALAPGAGSGRRLTNADLTIVSFGSVHGEVDHCG